MSLSRPGLKPPDTSFHTSSERDRHVGYSTGNLKLTGERTLPGVPKENYWFRRHLIAYEFAQSHAKDKIVLDIGCGEGYGSYLLSKSAIRVIGVDIAPEVIEHASTKYKAANLSFEIMDVAELKFDEDFADLVVSLQVIEHLPDELPFLREMARVLKKNGEAILSTPNRKTISPGSLEPINPFHFREYTPFELQEVLSDFFEEVKIHGVFHSGILRLNDRLKAVDFIKVYEMGWMNPRLWLHRFLCPLIRTSDFKIAKNDLENCLDIIAVCHAKKRGPAKC